VRRQDLAQYHLTDMASAVIQKAFELMKKRR
jgi:hypothetical protein